MQKPEALSLETLPCLEGLSESESSLKETISLEKPRCPEKGGFVGHLYTFVPEPQDYDEIERRKDEVGLYDYIKK